MMRALGLPTEGLGVECFGMQWCWIPAMEFGTRSFHSAPIRGYMVWLIIRIPLIILVKYMFVLIAI